MLVLHDISFSYKKNRSLFSGLNLELQEGSIYGLLGKNGAGKTTLLRIINGLLFPHRGTCRILGYDPAQRHPDFLKDVFFIPEELYIPNLAIHQFSRTYSVFYPDFDNAVFNKILGEFELQDTEKLTQLSYGQKKKVMLAFGIATNCRLLILDEPTNGLDIPSKAQFRKVLTETIGEHRTVIISTHQVRDLGSLMDPIIVLDGGKILFNSSIEEITHKLEFRLVHSLEPPVGSLYHERVPGGYLAVFPNERGRVTEADIEVLFNAITSKNHQVIDLFQNEVAL